MTKIKRKRTKVYYLCPFVELFPEQGMNECRVMHIRSHPSIPDDSYALSEVYCIDPECDCRRVLLSVIVPSGKQVATIGWGFDQDGEKTDPYLDPLNPQSPYAGALLEIVRVVLSDPAYAARLESHYEQVKAAVRRPTPAIRRAIRPRTAIV